MTTKAERDVADAIRLLAASQPRIRKAFENLALHVPSGWPSGGGLGVAGGDTPDPVGNAGDASLALRELHMRICSLAAEAKGVATELDKSIDLVPQVGVDAEREWRNGRCCGGEGDWARPECIRYAERKVDSDLIPGMKLPLCWSCISRRRRHLEQAS